MKKNFCFLTLLCIIFSVANFVKATDQSQVDRVCAKLEQTLAVRFDHWKYSPQMAADVWKPGYDDQHWKTLAIHESVYPDSAWLRKTIVIPKRIAGQKVNGGQLKLVVSVDDAGICWINSEKRGLFQWDGEFVLTENARSGEIFNVAIKAINTGGPMRLLEAKLEWDRIAALTDKIQDYITSLKVGQKLLSSDTYLRTGRVKLDSGIDLSRTAPQLRSNLMDSLEAAAGLTDLAALEQGNLAKFESSLQKSRDRLKPVANFAKKFTLIFDSNAHIDCAWLWRYLETINVTKNTFSSVLDMMEARADFTYTQSQAHLYWWIEDMFPEIFQRIKQRVVDGRWELVGGMWVEPDCNLISGESWARQLLYGKKYFKEKFGVDVKIGWNPDSFGYNWNMPQFYRDAGIDAFITQKIGWNDTNMFPYRLFWWEAPDGARLLTYFPNSYVNEIKNPFELADWLRQFEANTGFKKMLVLYGVGDHGGGPDIEMINRIGKLKQLDVYPNVEYDTATDYLRWIRSHDLTELPVWNDELYLEYHRGTYTTQSNTKKFNRQSEIQFGNAEQLASIANLLGRRYPKWNFFEGWRGVMFNQFHDILPGSSIYPVYQDSDELYRSSLEIAEHELNQSLLYLAQQIDTRVKDNARPILIYNPLAWQRTDVVELTLPNDQKQLSVLTEAGEPVPSQIVAAGKYHHKLLFIAQNVPATGYKIYQLNPKKNAPATTSLKAENNEIQNQFFHLSIDPETGWLKSITDRRSGREYLAGFGNELQLFQDTPDAWDAWNICLGERFPTVFRGVELVESGPVRAALRVKHDFLKPGEIKSYPTPNNPNSYFVQDIILYDGIDRIDFVTQADWWEERVMLKVAFETAAHNDAACFEIPFGTIYRPTNRNTDWEKARFEVSQQKWADLSDASQQFGISLLNCAKYGGDVTGNVMRLSLLRSPKWPDPMADMGKHSIDYALFPHQGNWESAGAMRKGYEYNYPLIAKLVNPKKGHLPPSHSFVSVEPENVILHTVKIAEADPVFNPKKSTDNVNAWVLRLFEYCGKQTTAEIRFHTSVKRAVISDILENVGDQIPVEDNLIRLKLPANRIITIKVWL